MNTSRASDKFALGLLILYLFSLVTSITGMEIFISLLGTFTLWKIARGEWKINALPFPALGLPLLTFSAVVVVGIVLGEATTQEKLYDLKRLRFVVVFFVLYWFLSAYFAHKNYGLKQVFRVFLVFLGLLALYSGAQHFVPLDWFRPEGKKIILYGIHAQQRGTLVLGTFNHHLTFSNVLLFYAALALALGTLWNRRPKLSLLVGAMLIVDCFWTQSRTAWVAIPVVLFSMAAWVNRRTLGFAILGGSLLTASYVAFEPVARERFTRTFFQEDAQYNPTPRVRLWWAQLEMWKDSPWVGLGYNNNERQAGKYLSRLYPHEKDLFGGHAHSTPLQILSTTGLLGLAAFAWLWAVCFRGLGGAIRHARVGTWERALLIGLFGGFVGFHVQGISQWNFGDAEVLHNVFFLLALGAVVQSRVAQDSQVLRA